MEERDAIIREFDEALAAELREKEILTRYAGRKMTRTRAAALLKVSERQVNRLMADRGLERVEGKRRQIDEEAKRRREMRRNAAELARAGKITIEQAALRAGCSERTIYRYLVRMEAKKKR